MFGQKACPSTKFARDYLLAGAFPAVLSHWLKKRMICKSYQHSIINLQSFGFFYS